MTPQLSENVEVWRVRSSRSEAMIDDPKGDLEKGRLMKRVNGLHLLLPPGSFQPGEDTARRMLLLDTS